MTDTSKLDEYCAKNNPIRAGDKHNYRVKCNPMDKDWKRRVSEDKWWGQPRPPLDKMPHGIDIKLFDLKDTLLAIGGESACLPDYEQDIDKITQRGQLWGHLSLLYLQGEISQCHTNSALAWKENQDKLFIATGYALSKDGMWRQHSWCIQVLENTPHIIETTEARELYFGFVMTLEETLEFVDMNTNDGSKLNAGTAEQWQSRFPELYQKTITAKTMRPSV